MPVRPRPEPRAILSVQSSVSYGHVGNAAAVFCLRRSGVDVWPVDTVAFSNHPGYGRSAGRVRPAVEIAEIIDGLREIGVFARLDGLLSGYLGSAETGAIILSAAQDLKRARPSCLWCCDPVMGDHGPGVYVEPKIVDFFRNAATPAADILVPNSFELELLTGVRIESVRSAVAAASKLLEKGSQAVIVTSVAAAELGAEAIANVAVTRHGAWLVTTPRLRLAAKGCGDMLAALLFARLLNLPSVPDALAAAVSSVFAVVAATAQSGANELCLVAAQNELVDPPHVFSAQPIA